MTTQVRQLTVSVPAAALDDLRDRLRRTRWPEPETVTAEGGLDWSQGPPLEYVAELSRYWADEYDWRRLEGELNAHGSSVTEIDGLDIHFLQVRSERDDARPLILTHGWPSSVVEPMSVMDELANPSDPDAPAFHVVAPALPGFGFSGRPSAPGWSCERTADAWAELMTRLGHPRFFAAGGDWGGRVSEQIASRHPGRVDGLHTFTPYVAEPDEPRPATPDEERWLDSTRAFWRLGAGYSLEQSTRPQTVAYGLTDSPVAQLTWILDKFQAWTDCDGHPENAITRDRMLDTVSLYWLTGTGGSSARFYWENFPPPRETPVTVPSAVTVFPADIEKLPRSWVEQRFTDLRSWRSAERGGHFPALEVPESYVEELRQSVKTLSP